MEVGIDGSLVLVVESDDGRFITRYCLRDQLLLTCSQQLRSFTLYNDNTNN
jgi:hypothetical protein